MGLTALSVLFFPSAAALVTAATEPLLAALAPLGPGGYLSASASQRKGVTECLRALATAEPAARCATALGGDWELLYTDAPDITGLTNSGPFVRLKRIGQSIDDQAGRIANVIEYTGREWLPGRAEGDTLQQRVLLDYTVDGGGRKVSLSLVGLSLLPRQIAGVNLAAAPPLTLQGPLTLPFGDFECVYNDGDVRVVRTAQGYWSVNRRLAEGEGWDD